MRRWWRCISWAARPRSCRRGGAAPVGKDGSERRCRSTAAILSAAAEADRVVTGGDDGKVAATDAEGDSEVLAADAKRRWIDHVAAGPNGV